MLIKRKQQNDQTINDFLYQKLNYSDGP